MNEILNFHHNILPRIAVCLEQTKTDKQTDTTAKSPSAVSMLLEHYNKSALTTELTVI